MTDIYLLDVNVLIALSWPQHVHHARAHSWFDSLAGTWATTPLTEAAYLRLSTNASVVSDPLTMSAGLDALAAIRRAPRHGFIADTSTLAEPAIDLRRVATSKQVTDAHLVNLAAASGAVLATLDRGIERWLMPHDTMHLLVLPA